MSELGDNARRLHEESLGWDPRRSGTPIVEAHKAADKRLQVLQDHHALHGRSLLLWAPDDLAKKVESMAHVMRQNGWQANTVDWASLTAVCLAGWCAADRAEEVSVTSGDAA